MEYYGIESVFLAFNDCYLCFYLCYYLCFCSVAVILLHCGSFCHENKFLVCVNIPGNKAHSDSDSDLCLCVMESLCVFHVFRTFIMKL